MHIQEVKVRMRFSKSLLWGLKNFQGPFSFAEDGPFCLIKSISRGAGIHFGK